MSLTTHTSLNSLKLSGDTETISSCLACGSSKNSSDRDFSASLGLIAPYGVVRCHQCGLRWLSPRPVPGDLSVIYSYENYFEGQSVESYKEVVRERLHHFRQRIRHLEHLAHPKLSLRILDIGAATGDFLALASERHHDVVGQEYSHGAREVAAKRYDIVLHDEDVAKLPFRHELDAIHMNHVLEHMPDPLATLRKCREMIRENGILIIEVPQQIENDLDRLKRLLRIARKPRFDAYSLHHTYFFTPRTLPRLVEMAGFSVHSVATSNPGRTPLWPPSLRNLFLRIYLDVADRTHSGGNIVEVIARA